MILMPYKDKQTKQIHDRAFNIEWYLKNKDRIIREKIEKHHTNRRKVIELLGGKCVRCGITDWRILQVNHINGNGSKERKIKGSSGIFREILNGKRTLIDLDLRCANCNILYEYDMRRGKCANCYQVDLIKDGQTLECPKCGFRITTFIKSLK